MNITGYVLMHRSASQYRGVQDRVYDWPVESTAHYLVQVFLQDTHNEPFDFVFADLQTARRALALAVEVERKDLEIVTAQVADAAGAVVMAALPIGVDVAYLGGDFYSAIHNGLLGANAANALRDRYGAALNANQLFDSPNVAAEYLKEFRSAAVSERDSEFVYYSLGSLERAG